MRVRDLRRPALCTLQATVPTEVFNLNLSHDVTVPSGGAGTITVTQIDPDDVEILVQLASGVLVREYHGGPGHVPFAFNISGAQPVSPDIAILHPVSATECLPATTLPCFTPTYGPVSATPYGSGSVRGLITPAAMAGLATATTDRLISPLG